MNNIIQKAIEGGYRGDLIGESKDGFWGAEEFLNNGGNVNDLICDPSFWQALGKACGWGRYDGFDLEEMARGGSPVSIKSKTDWKEVALEFHEINLTQSFDKAVEYLENLTK